MLRKEAGNSSSEAPREVRGSQEGVCGPWGSGSRAASAQPLLSRGVISKALQNGWNCSPSSDYYFHLHHSLAPTEDMWGTRGWEISVNLWNKMDKRFDLARTQLSTMLVVNQNCFLLLARLFVCLAGQEETAAVC